MPTHSLADVRSARNILLVELNRLGDVIHALPAARILRKNIPDSRISMLVERKLAALVHLERAVDRVIEAEETKKVRGIRRAVVAAREGRFDLVCSLSPIRRNALVARIGRTNAAAGYLDSWGRGPNFLKQNAVRGIGLPLAHPEIYALENISQTALKVCSAMGLTHSPDDLRFQPRGLPHASIPAGRYVVVHPFAGWKYREWPAEHIVEFLSRCNAFADATIVLIGDEEESARMAYFVRLAGNQSNIIMKAGLPLDALAGLLKNALLFVGTDSGPYQLAAALGGRVLGLFGPAPPEITGMPGVMREALYHRLECSPCPQQECIHPDNHCMRLITPTEVLDRIALHLARDAAEKG